MYEYDTSTRLIRVQFIVQLPLQIATCLVYLSSWLRRLRALPSGPTALTTGRRDRTGMFVFIWCDVRLKWRKENQILYCACKSTRSYSVGLQLRRHLFYCCTRICPCWWLYTGSTQIHMIPKGYESTRIALGPKLYQYLSTLLVLRCYSTKWLVNRRILVEHTSCEMHPSSAANRDTGWIIRRNWMTSYSSTAVLYGTYCRGKRGQRSTCLFQMT